MAKEKKVKKGKEEKVKKGKDKKAEKPAKGGSSEIVQTKYSGSIALSKLKHAILEKKNKKGKKIKCLVIPIEENFLTVGVDKDTKKPNGNIYMNISIITKTPQDDYGQNGFIGMNADSTMYKEAKEKDKEKMKQLPILGNIKNWDDSNSRKPANTDNSGNAGDIGEDDDLPF